VFAKLEYLILMKRLIHYVVWKAGKKDWFGATKLYKVLWFADARQFVLTKIDYGRSLHPRKIWSGPQAWENRPRGIGKRRGDQDDEGRVHDQNRGLRPPDISIFSHDELKTVDYWIEHIDRDHTAKSISDESHDYALEHCEIG
jgi:hypothetical protein